MARANGLCDEWYGQWSDDSTIEESIERFVNGFDFYLKTNFVSLEMIESIDRELLHKHHIYVNEDVDVKATESGYYIFLGNCKGTLDVYGLLAVTVYVRHDCDVDVKAGGGSKVFVTYYDDAKGDCTTDGWSHLSRRVRKTNK